MNQKQIEAEIIKIKARNKKVESDKAWEISWFRRGFLALITYIFAVWLFHLLQVKQAWTNALIPTGGFLISTLTIPILKKFWKEKIYKPTKLT